MLSSIILLASSCHASTATFPQGHAGDAASIILDLQLLINTLYHKTISDMTKERNSLAEDLFA